MSKDHVIGLASLPGAGKGEIAKELTKLGVEHLHIGGVVRSIAEEAGFVPKGNTREAYLPFWAEYAYEHGQGWLAELAMEKAVETDSILLLDGVRIPADAEMLTKDVNSSMVWLEGNLTTLAERVDKRGRGEDAELTEGKILAKMQNDLADKGSFSMGAVRSASQLFLLPVPEIEDPEHRADYYIKLAKHILDICGLASNSPE